MKAIIAAIFLLAVFNKGVFSTIISSQSGIISQSSSISIVGDIRVETIDGIIHCDSMTCPNNSVSCQVTKRNDPNDFMKIIRHRKCIDADGKVTMEEKRTESNPYGGTVNINVYSPGGGRKLTPEEQKELDEYLKKTQEMVQKQLAQVQESLRPFTDGSFQRNLQNQINQQVSNNEVQR